MSKSKTMLAALAAALIGLGFVGYNVANNSIQVEAKKPTSSSLTVAKIDYGTKVRNITWTPISTKKVSDAATLTNIADSNLTYTVDNVFAQSGTSSWNPSLALQIGGGYWSGSYATGSLTISFKNIKYQSIRLNVRADESKNFYINGNAYPVTTSWANTDLYYCGSATSEAITIKSEKVNDPFIWISSIEIHY